MISSPIKYQIFLSSTYEDLIPERTSVIETILRTHHFPVGMEMFNSNSKEQWEVITDTIDSSDIYILIVSHMYGSLTNGKVPISFTQKEFDYALKRRRKGKLRILAFIRDDSYSLPSAFIEKDAYKIEKLRAFKRIIDNSSLTRMKFQSKDDLSSKIATSLASEIQSMNHDTNLFGWIKRDSIHPIVKKAAIPLDETHSEAITTVLLQAAEKFESVVEDFTTYTFDSSGSCIIERTRKQIAITPVTHALVNYSNDKEGDSEIISILDMESYSKALSLPFIITQRDGKNFNFIILYNRVVNPGTYFKYRYKVKIKNFISSLIDSGRGELEFFSYPKNCFKSKTDIFSFPDTLLFKDLNMFVSQTVNEKIVEDYVYPINKNGRKMFEFKYEPVDHECYIKINFNLKLADL